MRLKDDSVKFEGMSVGILAALPIIERIHKELTGRQVVITSANDGVHREGSKHYSGDAVDLRVWYTDEHVGLTTEWAKELWTALGADYDVVYGDPSHMNHIHIEHDPS